MSWENHRIKNASHISVNSMRQQWMWHIQAQKNMDNIVNSVQNPCNRCCFCEAYCVHFSCLYNAMAILFFLLVTMQHYTERYSVKINKRSTSCRWRTNSLLKIHLWFRDIKSSCWLNNLHWKCDCKLWANGRSIKSLACRKEDSSFYKQY